jgi:hypothetical protein
MQEDKVIISSLSEYQQFNKDELECISDAVGFTIACLDSNTTPYMCQEMKSVLRIVQIYGRNLS